MKKTRLMVTGSIVGLAMLSVQPAFAQSASPDAQADEDEEEVAEEDNAPISRHRFAHFAPDAGIACTCDVGYRGRPALGW